MLRAQLFEKMGKFQKAELDFESSIKGTTYRPERFLVKRGNYWMRRDQFKLAIEDYRDARSVSPSYAEAWLGEVNGLIKTQNSEAALSALEEYIKLKPNDAESKNLKEMILAIP